MQKITLNFFGEKAEINLPKTLRDLRKQIADQFLFSPQDTLELIVSYVMDFKRTIIKTVNDYINLLSYNEITELNLEISENSRLYLEKKNSIQNEEELLKEQQEKLKQEIEVIKQNNEIVAIQTQMRELRLQINELVKKMFIERSKKQALLQEKKKALLEIEKKLNVIPSPETNIENDNVTDADKIKTMFGEYFNYYHVQRFNRCIPFIKTNVEVKEESPINQQEVIHPHVLCDGCKIKPIKGVRYKCAICHNFDYCAACEEKYAEIHQHPFIKINNPTIRLPLRRYHHMKMPKFDKTIHQ